MSSTPFTQEQPQQPPVYYAPTEAQPVQPPTVYQQPPPQYVSPPQYAAPPPQYQQQYPPQYAAPPPQFVPPPQQLPPNAAQSLFNPSLYNGQNPWVTSPMGQGSNAIMSLILNFLLIGLGHIVMGQTRKGVGYLVWYFIHIIVGTIIVTMTFGLGFPIYIIFFIHWIVCMVDGAMIGQRLDRGYPVHQGECAFTVAKFGMDPFVTPFPCFVNTDRARAPADWVNAIQSFEMSRGLPATV